MVNSRHGPGRPYKLPLFFFSFSRLLSGKLKDSVSLCCSADFATFNLRERPPSRPPQAAVPPVRRFPFRAAPPFRRERALPAARPAGGAVVRERRGGAGQSRYRAGRSGAGPGPCEAEAEEEAVAAAMVSGERGVVGP